MKNRELILHPQSSSTLNKRHGCALERKGGKRPPKDRNPESDEIQAVGRRDEIVYSAARKICRCLNIPAPPYR